MLNVIEQFKSIQGESTYAGVLCSFVRLEGCNLSCAYCDTTYAQSGGVSMSTNEIISVVEAHRCSVVEITGGEPLMQDDTAVLCRALLDKNYTVLVETNGSRDIQTLPDGCVRIVDVKCPGSGMADSFLESNIAALRSADELKFVISHAEDFAWALEFVTRRMLHKRVTVIFSPVTGKLASKDLAQWIIDASAPVRLGLQLHTFIWGCQTKGR